MLFSAFVNSTTQRIKQFVQTNTSQQRESNILKMFGLMLGTSANSYQELAHFVSDRLDSVELKHNERQFDTAATNPSSIIWLT